MYGQKGWSLREMECVQLVVLKRKWQSTFFNFHFTKWGKYGVRWLSLKALNGCIQVSVNNLLLSWKERTWRSPRLHFTGTWFHFIYTGQCGSVEMTWYSNKLTLLMLKYETFIDFYIYNFSSIKMYSEPKSQWFNLENGLHPLWLF